MNVSCRVDGATLTARILSALTSLGRLRHMPVPRSHKVTAVLTHILPKALYGSEATHVSQGKLATLRAAIANVIGPRSLRASSDLAFAISDRKRDLDPETHILHLRLAQLRRAILHAPDDRPRRTVVDCIRLHQAAALPDPTLFTSPVGLLLDQLRCHSVAISCDLWLTRPGFPPMHLLHSAWPHLRSVASDWCNADRAAEAGRDREHASGLVDIDRDLVQHALAGMDEAAQRVLSLIHI